MLAASVPPSTRQLPKAAGLAAVGERPSPGRGKARKGWEVPLRQPTQEGWWCICDVDGAWVFDGRGGLSSDLHKPALDRGGWWMCVLASTATSEGG